ncbi:MULTISPECIES: DUF1127 domain-containing protein [unclassified Mesorhizobium]|uniref:DUF1127 domain-containing protein n=1 Tax=unclassified Mesorhizobium TaxID=325217 RepID=UPI000FCCC2E9|nr:MULTISPECIES: DUF1127 domain-containing protein [unclassified Mesorhizobium]RUZ71005.1 DUF1127 domain-containing protein [Mesorhizobium sp. M7A.F.Ca.US.003.02.2.1]MDF3150516.1 DUF1127 domain-containing protein [Mesorhizobium sp. XAP10]MDF3243402.1 DUF1127 domain-containing protein [Mesorhizobium sp. XAP4]RUY95224.1 DUF1127 domain-containing protein [Mesorhizobium sp. M7A.F.Ca.CA.001.12.2.1]RUZ29170.1 DUF1127 domain-containing protein [Mesorhizobium sp. M7A.F.Ca.US.007.01.2.1]
MTNTLTCAARPGTPVRPASRRLLKTLRSIIASWHDRTWRERIRFRWQLRQMSKDNPHLIDDIGLTIQQVEEEIAKSFWER